MTAKQRTFTSIKALLIGLIIFVVFPFPLFLTSYKDTAGGCRNTAPGLTGCQPAIDASARPQNYKTVVRVTNILPGYLVDKQFQSCITKGYQRLQKCNSYTSQAFYKYPPYIGAVLPFVVAIAISLFAAKRMSRSADKVVTS